MWVPSLSVNSYTFTVPIHIMECFPFPMECQHGEVCPAEQESSPLSSLCYHQHFPWSWQGGMSVLHYLCRSICLSAGAAFLAPSCSLGALALPASRPPGLSWLPAALFLPLLGALFRSSFLVALPWESDLGRRPLLGLEGAGGPDSSTFSSGFCWIFSVPAAVTILFFPRSLLMLPGVGWSELIS